MHAPLQKQGKKLLALKDASGAPALLDAMPRATLPQAVGAHSSENMLSREMPPQRQHPPVRLQHAHLHQIRLEAPALAAYEALVLTRTRA